MGTRQEAKAKTRQAILRSAKQLLRARGLDGASVATVMQGAGLTVGGFYAHFESKESLMEEALVDSMSELREVLCAGADSRDDDARLRDALARYLNTKHRDAPERGCPLPALAGDLAEDEGPLRDALAAQLEAHAAALATRAGRDDALGALSLMVGALTLSRAVRGTPLSGAILRAAKRFGQRALD